MGMKKGAPSYITSAYATVFYAALGLSVIGAIMAFVGYNISALLWLYGGCFIAFAVCVTTDFTYTFHTKKTSTVELEMPKVVPEEIEVPAVAQKRTKA